MRLSQSHAYPCDAETVLAIHRERGYQHKKHASMAPGPVEFLEFGECQGRFRVAIKCPLPGVSASDVPRLARRFALDSYTLIYTEEWLLAGAADKQGRLRMRLEGMPLRIDGDLWLRSQGGGCTKEFDLDIQSGIPVISAKVEKEGARLVRHSLEKDLEFTRQYLQDRAG